MSRVPWADFEERGPPGHLVAATVDGDHEVGSPDLKTVQLILRSLIRIQGPAGDYATTMVRDAGQPALHLAFDEADDARRVASVLQAEEGAGSGPWATRWTARVDAATLDALAASLPPRRRRTTAEGPRTPRPSPISRARAPIRRTEEPR